MMLDKREDSKQLAIIKHKYGFDRPVSQQYMLYMNDVLPVSIHYNDPSAFTFLGSGKYNYIKLFSISNYSIVLKAPYLRQSFVRSGMPVATILLYAFRNTFLLASCSIIIALFLGLFLGIISALYKDTFIDKLILLISVLGMSLPSFFASIIIAWLFGFILQVRNLILPAITLGIRPLSVIIQLCRNSLLEVLAMDYVRTAISKGLSQFIVIFKHALRNALNPVITSISGWFASMLAGAVFVEYIFAWNGIGKEIVDALNKMDLPLVMGAVLLIASVFVVINIMVDLIYGYLDPRIRLS